MNEDYKTKILKMHTHWYKKICPITYQKLFSNKRTITLETIVKKTFIKLCQVVTYS